MNFFRKYGKGKLELVMSVHVDDIYMAGKPEKLKVIKEISRRSSTSQSPEKSRSFLESMTSGVRMRNVRMQKGPWRKT